MIKQVLWSGILPEIPITKVGKTAVTVEISVNVCMKTQNVDLDLKSIKNLNS